MSATPMDPARDIASWSQDKSGTVVATVAAVPSRCALYEHPADCDVWPHCSGPDGCAATRWECGEDADCGNYNCSYHHGDMIVMDDDDFEDDDR